MMTEAQNPVAPLWESSFKPPVLCADCGKECVPGEFSTGYGVYRDADGVERRVCYECCGTRDRDEMIATGRGLLYLVKASNPEPHYRVRFDGLELTNWPGTLRYRLRGISNGRHNIAGTRTDVWFVGPDAKEWHGVQYGENTQICHVRRTKGRKGR